MPIEALLRHETTTIPSRTPAGRFSSALTTGASVVQPGPYLEVRSVATGLATFYEKIRNTLDFRDEHLIRIYAIRRILKRRLVRGVQAERITVPLLQELIRGGYIPNTSVPESSVRSYQRLIGKYIQLFNSLGAAAERQEERKDWDWVFTLAANELEERLVPSPQRKAIAASLLQAVEEEHLLGAWDLSDPERRRQTLIAIHRAFLKLNNELISWPLFNETFPDWLERATPELVQTVAQHFSAVRANIDEALHHAAGDRLARHLKPVTTTLWLLQATLHETADRERIISHPQLLTEALGEIIQEHYKTARKRLQRTLRRSLFYILITKMAIALLVEVPLDRLLQGGFDLPHLGFNIVVPPLLLLIFGGLVRIPGKKNTEEIQTFAERLVYDGRLDLEPVRPPASYRRVVNILFNLAYAIIYVATFGVIVGLLVRFGFTFVGIAIFLFFLSVVSFFGFRIREQAHELIVTRGQESFPVFLAVLFFLPILRTGRWISQQSSKINLFLYFFDLFIEAPLQAFLEFFDKFTGFVRQKKDDVTS